MEDSRFCGGRFYGGRGTIHGTTDLDVETDKNGNVVAVWFRCQPLPFNQTVVDAGRAKEMRGMYQEHMPELLGVELLEQKK